ncbi:MAG: endo-1,4-beta-xylanase [Candidatus Cohnella colombiensis]|uniref:Beta-xylanase n=1 Tax=Candidatus Cohnella colombiensis TaxID=3121368 RepID=A0AA95EX98_9BACL|nr:MAG: endo-1,4-beta-xylanase [Cohnella sp.]
MNRPFKKFISVLLASALIIPSGWIAPTAKAATPDIPVLLYHQIVPTATQDTQTSVANFRKHMKYLSANGYTTLTADEYVAIIKNGATAPPKPILLTFDDATPDFVTNAVPILEEQTPKMNAVQFVVTGWIGGGYSMTKSQLDTLVTDHPNISIQNHSVNHAENTWNSMTQSAASTEIATANTYIKGVTGKDPILFAYPYGQYNANVQAAAQANGIQYSFKVGYPNNGDHAMGRHYIQKDTTLSQIASWIGGPTPAPESGTTVYHETFASGKGIAYESGGATLTPVTGKVFNGNADGAALYVANRTNNYDAADFDYSKIGLVNGKTYTVTVSVYVDPDVTVPSGAQAYLQTISSYGLLANANYVAGEAITLTREFTVNTTSDTKLRVQSNEAGKEVPFYIGDVLITEKSDANVVYHESFDSGKGSASQSGGANLEVVTGKVFNGNADGAALYVSNRSNNWDAADFKYSAIGLKDKHTYTVTVSVYVDDDVTVPSGAQAYLQTIGSYGLLANANYVAGAALTLSKEFTVDTSKDSTLRVQSNEEGKGVPFYIGDVLITEKIGGVQKYLTPIKDIYTNDFLIGNAVSSADLDGSRLELLKLHHNIATAENAMKPDALYDANKQFTPGAADAIVNKVLAEGLQMHGHVLVWHQQSPDWLNTSSGSPLDKDTALLNLQTHIRTVMEHFGNKVISWDVVNEAMNDNPSNPTNWKAALRQAPWKAAIGDDYVEQAFLAARAVLDDHPSWDIKLYYNDYNEDNQNKAQAIYSMVKDINDKYAQTHPGKLLIDGVGMQGHYNINTKPNNVKLSLEKFISLGVEVSITELDISAGSNSQLSETLSNAQGYLYAQLFDLFKSNASHIKRVTFWGLNDASSWRAANSPLLFDKDLQAKPAYDGVIDPEKFMEEHNPESANVNQANATYGTPTIDGTIDAVWSGAPSIPINRFQMAWQGASGVAKALWDDQNLYVLFQVSDAQLDKGSANAYEQDSVEVFLDENNEKTSFYQPDDGQYRVNFDNETSFNPTSIANGFESATKVSGTNYVVEVKIPFKSITPDIDMKLGFDVQINDGKDGARQSVATWNDTTGQGYQDTSVYGVLTLVGKATDPNSGGFVFIPPTGNVVNKDGIVTIKPVVNNEGGRVTGKVSAENLKNALEQAASAANGKKQIVVEVPKQGDAKSYEVQLPTQSLKGQENFVLSIETENATVEVPSNMLSNVTVSADQVSIRIAKASTDDLDAATREQIGNRPILDLSMVVGDKVIAWNNPNAPVTISIPYTPTAEELSNPDSIVVWYIDGNGNATAIPNGRYDTATGTVVFQTTHFSTYAVATVVKTFGDLNNVPWAKQAIEAMAARDVIKGISANSYSPSTFIKRADFIALLVRALELQGSGKNTAMFSDVPQTAYYYNELVIANELGIVTGLGDNTFKPNSNISRQDMMVLTARALKAAGKQVEAAGTLDAYPDAASISDYAKDSAAVLVKSGVVNGKNGKIAPNDPLTRAEAAVILYRIWKLKS